MAAFNGKTTKQDYRAGLNKRELGRAVLSPDRRRASVPMGGTPGFSGGNCVA
jgi:hypothetical protein